jgi:hypothetical protein
VNHDTEYDVKSSEPAHSSYVQASEQAKVWKTDRNSSIKYSSACFTVQKNFEILDAIIPPRVGLQMTVASSHSIETAGLYQVVNALECTKQRRFTLYFVVPRATYL